MNGRITNSMASVAMLLLVTVSCRSPESYSPDSTPGQLVPEQFADLAVPQHLKLQTGLNQSYTFKRGDYRLGHLEYRGKGKIIEDRQYLREQLHQRGWKLKLEDIPMATKVVQKWTNHVSEGVYYTLLATLEAKGKDLFLTYDLRIKTNSEEGEAVNSTGNVPVAPTGAGAKAIEADLKPSK